MNFQQEDTIAHPANLVLDVMIRDIEAIVPFLPNVERIDTLETQSLPDGRQRIIRRWEASSDNVPATLRPFISRDWLAWTDTAVWSPAEYKVDWTLSTKLGRLYDCSGTNSFEPDPKAPKKRTHIRINGNLTVYPPRIPGIPSLLTKRIGPTAERFIVDMLTRDLTSLAKGLDGYLSQAKRRP